MRFGGALLAGIVFAFSLFFVVWVSWPHASVWALPALAAAAHRPRPAPPGAAAGRRPGRGRGAAVLRRAPGVELPRPGRDGPVLRLPAGHAAPRRGGGRRPARRRRGSRRALAGGTALAAITLLPFLELLSETNDVDVRGRLLEAAHAARVPARLRAARLLGPGHGDPDRRLRTGARRLRRGAAAAARGRRARAPAARCCASASPCSARSCWRSSSASPLLAGAHRPRADRPHGQPPPAGHRRRPVPGAAGRVGAGRPRRRGALPPRRVVLGAGRRPARPAGPRPGRPRRSSRRPASCARCKAAWDPRRPADQRRPTTPRGASSTCPRSWPGCILMGAGLALVAARLRSRLPVATFVALALALTVVDLFRAGMGQTPAIDADHADQPADARPALPAGPAARPLRRPRAPAGPVADHAEHRHARAPLRRPQLRRARRAALRPPVAAGDQERRPDGLPDGVGRPQRQRRCRRCAS